MNISNCPRCHDPIRIPESGLSPASHAQCPWCGDQFPLAEVLNQLPPMLKILSDDGLPVTDDSHDSQAELDVQSFELQDAESPLDESGAADGETTLQGAGVQALEAGNPGFPERVVASRPTPPARRQKKSGGALKGIIGIVAGGLLALPIAGGILWGVGKGFDLGPFADSGEISIRQTASKPVDRSGSDDRNTMDQPIVPAVETAPVAIPDIAGLDAIEPDVVEPDVVERDTVEPATADRMVDDFDEPGLSLPESDDVATTDLAGESQPVGNPVEVIDLDVDESPELVSKIEKAKDMIDAIRKFKPVGDKRNTWLTTAYRTIAEASEMAAGDGPSIQQLAQSIRDSDVLDEFEDAGSVWMNTTNRSNDGVLIVGTLNDRTVTLGAGDKATIVSQSPLPPSGRVLVLGRISSDKTVEAILVESL